MRCVLECQLSEPTTFASIEVILRDRQDHMMEISPREPYLFYCYQMEMLSKKV